jgi:hypothetical protein
MANKEAIRKDFERAIAAYLAVAKVDDHRISLVHDLVAALHAKGNRV